MELGSEAPCAAHTLTRGFRDLDRDGVTHAATVVIGLEQHAVQFSDPEDCR